MLMAGIGLDASVVQARATVTEETDRQRRVLDFRAESSRDLEPSSFHARDRRTTSTRQRLRRSVKQPRYGGDLAITPGARLDQPEFEVCIIETSSRLALPALALARDAQRHAARQTGGALCERNDASKPTATLPVQIDGELIGHLPMRFEIAPHSLEVIVP